ncbi:MAG: hydroxymethylglutaryl-CoA reductase [Nanoarchaeota archaeon]|nr:hydroxymethylglutaryl-CoA reductase [Nanoarchaeota archaeon]
MAINSGLKDNADNVENEKLIERLVDRTIKFYELDIMLEDPERAVALRLRAVEKITGREYSEINKYSILAKEAKPNIENMIGTVQVPLGIAGPVRINGDYAKGDFFVPIATTEGALTASINRGCSVLNSSGGASVRITKIGQTRSAMFAITKSERINEFIAWADDNFSELKREAEKESKFLRLKKIEKYSDKDTVWLRIVAETGDAMGMNMITIAAKNLGLYVEENFEGVKFLSESGNLCVDKKPSRITFEQGRGRSVVAEATIPGGVVKKYLKTTTEQMVDINHRKNHQGSELAGSFGYNAQFANVIAGIFLATGQDMAHVVEGSHGITDMDVVGEGLHVRVTLPAVLVGTVGGGTHLPCQSECLDIVDCRGSGKSPGDNASKFAEIIAAAVLAGEISLIGALSARQLSEAHKKHNR